MNICTPKKVSGYRGIGRLRCFVEIGLYQRQVGPYESCYRVLLEFSLAYRLVSTECKLKYKFLNHDDTNRLFSNNVPQCDDYIDVL